MTLVIDQVIDTRQDADGVYRPVEPARPSDDIAEAVGRGLGAVEEIVRGGAALRDGLRGLRQVVRRTARQANPTRRARKAPRSNPDDVVDAEEL